MCQIQHFTQTFKSNGNQTEVKTLLCFLSSWKINLKMLTMWKCFISFVIPVHDTYQDDVQHLLDIQDALLQKDKRENESPCQHTIYGHGFRKEGGETHTIQSAKEQSRTKRITEFIAMDGQSFFFVEDVGFLRLTERVELCYAVLMSTENQNEACNHMY